MLGWLFAYYYAGGSTANRFPAIHTTAVRNLTGARTLTVIPVVP